MRVDFFGMCEYPVSRVLDMSLLMEIFGWEPGEKDIAAI